MGRWRYVRLSAKQRFWIWLILIAAVLGGTACAVLIHMDPIVTGMATARVSNTVNRIVMEAAEEAIRDGYVTYSNLVELERDNQGQVVALKSDMAECNRLQALIAEDILQRLSEVSTTTLSIPIGTLTGLSLLAGRGPSIRVKMQMVGSATASFRNSFSSAGINQTRHQILLQMDVSVSILLPGFRTSTKVSNELTVAESVIVGTVPQTYTYFSASPETMDDYAEEYILNNG